MTGFIDEVMIIQFNKVFPDDIKKDDILILAPFSIFKISVCPWH
jgi:hypothetical protein